MGGTYRTYGVHKFIHHFSRESQKGEAVRDLEVSVDTEYEF